MIAQIVRAEAHLVFAFSVLGCLFLATSGADDNKPKDRDRESINVDDIIAEPVLVKDATDPEKNRLMVKFKWRVNPADLDLKRDCRVSTEFGRIQQVGTVWTVKETYRPLQPVSNQRSPTVEGEFRITEFHVPNRLFAGDYHLSVTWERVDPENRIIWRIKRIFRIANGVVQRIYKEYRVEAPSLTINLMSGNRVKGETNPGSVVSYMIYCPGSPGGAATAVVVGPDGKFEFSFMSVSEECLLCVTAANPFGQTTTVCVPIGPPG